MKKGSDRGRILMHRNSESSDLHEPCATFAKGSRTHGPHRSPPRKRLHTTHARPASQPAAVRALARTLPAPDASERPRAPLLRAGAEQRPDGYAISFVTAFAYATGSSSGMPSTRSAWL